MEWRFSILRIFWDNQEYPSVECPIGDFFACGWGKFASLLFGCLRKSRQRLQFLLAHAFSEAMPHYPGEHR